MTNINTQLTEKIQMEYVPGKKLVYISPDQVEKFINAFNLDPSLERCKTIFEIGYYLSDDSMSVQNFDEANKFYLIRDVSNALKNIPYDLKIQLKGVNEVIETLDSVIKIGENSPARQLRFEQNNRRNKVQHALIFDQWTGTAGVVKAA